MVCFSKWLYRSEGNTVPRERELHKKKTGTPIQAVVVVVVDALVQCVVGFACELLHFVYVKEATAHKYVSW